VSLEYTPRYKGSAVLCTNSIAGHNPEIIFRKEIKLFFIRPLRGVAVIEKRSTQWHFSDAYIRDHALPLTIIRNMETILQIEGLLNSNKCNGKHGGLHVKRLCEDVSELSEMAVTRCDYVAGCARSR